MLTKRIMLGLIVVVALTCAAGGAASYGIARYALVRQLDRVLTTMADGVATRAAAEATLASYASGNQGLGLGSVITVITPSGPRYAAGEQRVSPTDDDLALAEQAQRTGAAARHFYTATNPGGPDSRVLVVALPDPGYAVMLARPLSNQRAVLTTIGAAGGILSVFSALIFVLVARRLVAGALAPVRILTEAVQHTARTGSLQPVAIAGRTDMTHLAVAFNDLLLTLSLRRQQQLTLISNARHELRTPLTSIRTNIDLLVMDQESSMLPVKARAEILTDVKFQIEEFTSLINDLVWLEEEQQHLERPHEIVDLGVVIGDALRRARRRGQGLTFDVKTTPLLVEGDQLRLERAVLNVLDNAVKYSPRGGTITVRISDNELRITDEGPGIPVDELPHIFERHFRSRHNPAAIDGTGIGLAIVDEVVGNHGGTVTAHNRTDRSGAEFVFWFPAADPSATT